MSNDYFDSGDWTPMVAHTRARAEAVNAALQGVEAGFDKLPAEALLKSGRVTYATDTGAANAYVVALAHAPASYVAGLRITLKASGANTGASTLNVNGLGVVAIRRQNGDALQANDIAAGGIVTVVHDGSVFRMASPQGASEANAAASAAAAATSATNAAGSASSASSSASSASSSATTATNAKTDAEAAQTAAETAETNAAASASAAATSETNAAASETNAETSATNAAASEAAAAASAAAAATSEANAATSEANAATSEANASDSADAAAASALEATSAAERTFSRFTFTATGGETSISGADDNANTLAYTPGNEWVLLNGVLLVRGTDYTATDGATIDSLSALTADDILVVIAIGAFQAFADIEAWSAGTYAVDSIVTHNGAIWRATVETSGEPGVSGWLELLSGGADGQDGADGTDGTTAGFRNAIINGNFDIWQRGTSQTSSGYGSDDRWENAHSGTTKTHSRQAFALGQTDVPGEPEFFSRTAVSSVGGAGNFCMKTQKIENVRTFAGQTVTVSFWAKADASKDIAIEFAQDFGSGGSPSSAVNAIGSQKFALTTDWQKFTATVAIPSISGKTIGTDNNSILMFRFWFDAGSDFDARTDELGQQSGTFDIAQVQLEPGDGATEFEHRPIAAELALCQRYFQEIHALSHTSAWATITNSVIAPTPMRAGPTLSTTVSSGSGAAYSAITSAASGSVLVFQSTGNSEASSSIIAMNAEL